MDTADGLAGLSGDMPAICVDQPEAAAPAEIVLTLRFRPVGNDPHWHVKTRRLLKALGRYHGFRCVRVDFAEPEPQPCSHDKDASRASAP